MTSIKQGIIFDLDGTLWDSSEAVAESWNEMIKTFPDFHELISVEKMQSYMGMPMDEIAYAFFHMLPKQRALELMEICMAHENDYILRHGGKLFEGLEETLAKLQEKYVLAIVSNCQQGYIEAFLTYHQLGKYFHDTENFGNTGLQKGDNIRLVMERNGLDRAVYVGDTMGDYNETMRAAAMIAERNKTQTGVSINRDEATEKPEISLQFLYAAYGFGKVPEGTPSIADIRELPRKMTELCKPT